jgi:polyisoprenoid-binding protein YceI
MAFQVETFPVASDSAPVLYRGSSSRSVTLDRAWAERLGVHRTSGAYRISRRELNQRIQQLAQSAALPTEWEIDTAHTNVGFVARHLMLAKVRGGFKEFSGTISIGAAPEDTHVDVTVQTASIDTGLHVRDEHLRSADFLDSHAYPELRFRSTGLERQDENRFKLTGDLTIRGVTCPVTLDLDFLGTAKDVSGQLKAAFEARTQINREDFGITWNRVLEAGGVLVDKQVCLEIQAQAVPRAPAA